MEKQRIKFFGVLMGILAGLSLEAQNLTLVDTTCTELITKQSLEEYLDNSGVSSVVLTRCPEQKTPPLGMVWSFTNFTKDPRDSVIFYDGPDLTSDRIGAVQEIAGNERNFDIKASLTNPSGCLTLLYEPNINSSISENWELAISCGTPCQDFELTVELDNPSGYNVINRVLTVCPDEYFKLDPSFNFINNTQSEATVQTFWSIDGKLRKGSVLDTAFSNSKGYSIAVWAVDSNGCMQEAMENWLIRVSGPPAFLVGDSIPTEICEGETFTFTAQEGMDAIDDAVVVRPDSFYFDPIHRISDTIRLPDGQGSQYVSYLRIDDYAENEVINSGSDIQEICINIEHSFMPDLDVLLRCPSGKEVYLHELFSGNTAVSEIYLGNPLDDENNPQIPGNGFDYCFNSNAATDWTSFVQNLTSGGGAIPTLPSGNYLPSESFDKLSGCIINGLWELVITDHQIDDNGFLFGWNLTFDDQIPSKRNPFSPGIASLNWQIDQISKSDAFTQTFNTPGNTLARLTSTDEYGCSFDIQLPMRVLEAMHPACVNCNLLPGPDTIGYCSPNPIPSFFSRKKDTTVLVEFHQDFYHEFSTLFGSDLDDINLSTASAGIQQLCFDTLIIQAGGGFDLILESPSGIRSYKLLEWDEPDTLFLIDFCLDPNELGLISADTNRFSGNYKPLEDWSGNLETGEWKLKIDDGGILIAHGYLSTWTAQVLYNYDINFEWTPVSLTNALSCSDCANPVVYPDSLNGIQNTLTLLATDNLGCSDSTTLTIDSLPTYPPLQIDTFNLGPGRVLFKWTDYGPLSYNINVSINNASSGNNVLNINEYLLQNLTPGTQVSVEVSLKDPPCPTLPSTLDLEIPCFLIADTSNLLPPTCHGSEDGSVTITTQFATTTSPFFELEGSGIKNNQSFFDSLAPGAYRVFVTDASCRDTVDFVIPEKAPVEISFTTLAENLCFGDEDAGIKAAATGGNGGYIYQWTSEGIQSDSLTNLPAGSYPLRVTDTLGCSSDTLVSIIQPDSLSVHALITPPKCFGGRDGKIIIDRISGGTAPYQFTWGQGFTSSDSLISLSSGTYCVTITDQNGCSISKCFEMMDPDAIQIDSFIVIEPKCYSGSDAEIQAFVSGGTGMLTYMWNDPNMQLGEKANQLSAGVYELMVSDAFSCLATDSVRIGQPDSFYIEYQVESVTCYGDEDGNINVAGKGGKTPYSFNWNNNQSGHFLDSLSAGVYRVTATDGGNCTFDQVVEIPGPLLPLGASFNQTQKGCYGAQDNTVEVMGTGGMGRYQYIWEDSTEGPIISHLDTLSYSVYISDSSGCVDTFSFTPVDQISITPNILTNNPTCVGNKDGKIAAIVPTNDLANYEFLWNTGAQTPFLDQLEGDRSYTLTVTYTPTGCADTLTKYLNPPTDITFEINTTAVTCYGGFDGTAAVEKLKSQDTNFVFQWDFKTGYQNQAKAVGLKVGTYEVSIQNGEGCVKTAEVEITSPPPLNLNSSAIDNLCFGDSLGTMTVSMDGGIAPYSYRWSTGDSLHYLGRLSAGKYSVTATDANNCELIEELEITQPNPLEIETETQPVVCFGEQSGMIDIIPFGGTAPFTYSLDGVNFTTGSSFGGLPSGNFTAWIQDNNGCKSSVSTVIGSPPKILLDIGPPSLPLTLGDSVLLKASITNGNPPITINWLVSEPDVLNCLDCTEPLAVPDQLTFIEAVVTDANGCQASDKLTLIVDKNRIVAVPTGFSPNGDGQNDVLLVHGSQGTVIQNFLVYDQWGAVVHESGDFEVNAIIGGWDGKVRNLEAPPGTYLWKVEATFIDGITEVYSGSTTLIR